MTAAADEVSAAIALVFGAHGQAYQALGAQAATFHDQFVRTLSAGASGLFRVWPPTKAKTMSSQRNGDNIGRYRALGDSRLIVGSP